MGAPVEVYSQNVAMDLESFITAHDKTDEANPIGFAWLCAYS